MLPTNHHPHDTKFIIEWIDKLPTSNKLRQSVVDRYDEGYKLMEIEDPNNVRLRVNTWLRKTVNAICKKAYGKVI